MITSPFSYFQSLSPTLPMPQTALLPFPIKPPTPSLLGSISEISSPVSLLGGLMKLFSAANFLISVFGLLWASLVAQ